MKKTNLIVFCIIVTHFSFVYFAILQVISGVIEKKLKNLFCQSEKASKG